MIKRPSVIERKIVSLLNTLSLRRKLWLLYTCCVFIPLVLTDGLIAGVLFKNAQKELQKNMETAAFSASLDFRNAFDPASNLSNGIYINRTLNTFLEQQFKSNSEFYAESTSVYKQAGYSTMVTTDITNVVLCADNDTLVSAGTWSTIDKIRDTQWFQDFEASGREPGLYFYFSEPDISIPIANNMRMVTLVRELDYYSSLPSDKVLVCPPFVPKYTNSFLRSSFS